MTVAELTEKLAKLPQDAVVVSASEYTSSYYCHRGVSLLQWPGGVPCFTQDERGIEADLTVPQVVVME